MAKPPKELVDAVLDSLKNKPEEWRADEYKTRHVSGGVQVWTANSYCGAAIEIEEGQKKPWEFGGVTMWSVLLGQLIPWRRKVYNAAVALRPKPTIATPEHAIRTLRGEA